MTPALPPSPSSDPLVDLAARGAAGLPDVLRMAEHGDWRTRALAVSAAGHIAARENLVLRAWGLLVRRIPGWPRRFPVAGSRGRYVRNHITNGLFDRSWPVRVAAALGLGECRAVSKVVYLERLLKAPLRAERIAAAAAIVHCGGRLDRSAASLLAGAVSAPAGIGDSTRAIDFLATLASGHPMVLDAWTRIPGQDRPAGSTPAEWASFLAGPVPADTYSGHRAEIERYDVEGETEYLLTKPFSHINRVQNARLLHSFLVVSEHLRVPPGGRVLDLGGGSAWVSQLLTQFGFLAFTLDLSSALLTIGRRRFAREGLTPRFMVGDMARLPVATGSMDAVIVMDALHHVPDVPAVFREAFRVLAEGGQFLLAEPGEGHAETERARAEILEHGVEEREIHVFEMIDYGRAAGFDSIQVAPHYVPGIGMSPEQLRVATTSSADDWMMYQEDQPGYVSSYVIQSMLARPIVVFRKGQRRVDSRMPHILKAEIAPRLARAQARVTGTVSVRNVGDTTWLGNIDGVGLVQLGVRLHGHDRRPLNLDFGRVRLDRDLSPDDAIDIVVDLTLPDPAVPYVLKIDMVDEGITWFEDAGSRPVYVEV